MEDLKKFYSEKEIKMLELIDWVDEKIKRDIQAGLEDPDREQNMEFMAMARSTMKNSAERRRKVAERQKANAEYFENLRVEISCVKCKSAIRGQIIGEVAKTTTEGKTLKFDIIICPVCQTEFENEIPNNLPDIIYHLEFYLRGAKRVLNEPKKHPMSSHQRKMMAAAYERNKKILKTMKETLEEDEKDRVLQQEIDNILEGIYEDFKQSVDTLKLADRDKVDKN